MTDLFAQKKQTEATETYSAKDIVVLEGLDPVRKRPGMYIGGTDEAALHHLVAEVLDNAMDEAIAGHASKIELHLSKDGSVKISDNGRGIPVDPHPKYKDKSALEVILTTLHSGGKFDGKAYKTSGGLHGVGISVVNALSERLDVEIARDRHLWKQSYSKGVPITSLESQGDVRNRRGTIVTFVPDMTIFDPKAHFRPRRLYRMARSKAYLYKGVTIYWSCDEELVQDGAAPHNATLHYPNGIKDYLDSLLKNKETYTSTPFFGEASFPDDKGRVEWAISWPVDHEGFSSSYCNTIPTPDGGSHELGIRAALSKGLKSFGDIVGNKKASQLTPDDILEGSCFILSLFIADPQFQGQTKEKLSMPEAARFVENAIKDPFDYWLTHNPQESQKLLEACIERAEERLNKKKKRDLARQSATRRLRLPGKLSDCSSNKAEGTEIFLVEGDSAGGSAKQARFRETQAILPLRGKVLNVASATNDKLRANQEIQDITQALGCGLGKEFDLEKLRYERVIIMTDADVDGAHIASLLMTFFYKAMPKLIEKGHLFLAMPPLFRITQGSKSLYARDDAHKDQLLKKEFKGKAKIDISRFKGLGEMPPRQLKETTMDPSKRILMRVELPKDEESNIAFDYETTDHIVETLMGKKPELRFNFIQENAAFVEEVDV